LTRVEGPRLLTPIACLEQPAHWSRIPRRIEFEPLLLAPFQRYMRHVSATRQQERCSPRFDRWGKSINCKNDCQFVDV